MDYAFSEYISPQFCKKIYSDIFVKNNIDYIYNALFINAAGWLLTRQCISKVGGFSPSFYHYGEDANYLHRLKYFNLRLGVYPKCCIFHDREDRPLNTIHESEAAIYKRQIIIDISNPNSKSTFFSELIKIYIRLFVSLIKIRLFEIRKNLNMISVIYNIDKKFVIDNKKKSKCIGLTFIE